MYTNNIYNYESPYTMEVVQKKDGEIKPYVDSDLFRAIQHLRPYVGVIESMLISNVDSKIDKVALNEYRVEVKVDVASKATNGDIAKSTFTETLDISLEPLKISSVDTEAKQHYASYQDTEHLYKDEPLFQDLIVEKAINSVDNRNINYQFKGAPKENPFNSKNLVYLDSYNMIYWLYNTEELNLNYPLDYNSLINSDVFKYLGTSHKYLSDINSLELGDLLLFGKNNNTVGLYIGNKEYITIDGKFPKDTSTIKIYNLEKNWDKFNGRILRLKDEYQ